MRNDVTSKMKPCTAVNPATGNKCVMADGHFGPHKAGDVYPHTESFVIKCSGRECNYHHNSNGNGKHWRECIHCGDRIDIPQKEQDYHNWIDNHVSSFDIRSKMGETRCMIEDAVKDLVVKLGKDNQTMAGVPMVDFNVEDVDVVFEVLNDQESSCVIRVEPDRIWVDNPNDVEEWFYISKVSDDILLAVLEKLEQIDEKRSLEK